MRKGAAIAAVAAVLLCLTGCSAILEGERNYSQPHQSVEPEIPGEGEMTLEASEFDELCAAVTEMIKAGAERGTVRIAGYTGELESELAQAVLTASNDTPEGAYCVYYINYSLNRLVAMYEASISIVYRHTPEEAAAVEYVEDEAELTDMLMTSMEERAELVTLRVADGGVDETAIENAVESAYYANPGTILYIPTYTCTAYPEEGAERILEVKLTYPYATSTVEARRRSMDARANMILRGIGGGTDQERLMSMGQFFLENVTFDTSVNSSDIQARRYNAMTAYGAIVQGSAVGEGYAMAAKILCDKLGIECTVVRGRYNNIDHAWNIVTLDGTAYHVDMSAFEPEGVVFRNDEQQLYYNYWWDREAYPVCDGPSLYGPEFDPLAPNNGPEDGESQESGNGTAGRPVDETPENRPDGNDPGVTQPDPNDGGTDPGETTVPTDPEESGNPTEPTDPTEPDDPDDPAEPVDPGETIDPEDPDGPDNSEEPEEPDEPDPSAPEGPSEPPEPGSNEGED